MVVFLLVGTPFFNLKFNIPGFHIVEFDDILSEKARGRANYVD